MARARTTAESQQRRPEEAPPDRRQLTERQAAYLADLTGVEAKALVKKPISALDEILRWKIDPSLLLFRRVCGRVVRLDPGTGVLHGVPNATVHVEDTDCSFLGFFPTEGPFVWWWWFWPLFCRREEIATTTTDQCGRFCVWIPRWDIDRILRFRLERVCFPEIFRPTLRDFLGEHPDPFERPPRHPGRPEPARSAAVRPAGAGAPRAGGRRARPPLPRPPAQFGERRAFGEQTGELKALLDEPAVLESSPRRSRTRR